MRKRLTAIGGIIAAGAIAAGALAISGDAGAAPVAGANTQPKPHAQYWGCVNDRGAPDGGKPTDKLVGGRFFVTSPKHVPICSSWATLVEWYGDKPTQGPQGPKGDKGDPGVANPTTDGPYTTTWKGDGGATLQTATVKCDPGKVAVGGGFSQQGGADDLGGTDKDIQVTVSVPYTSDYQPVNDRGSFVPDEWIVKGYNSGTTDAVIRPWVTCVDMATAAPAAGH